jgi:hypothetical protein
MRGVVVVMMMVVVVVRCVLLMFCHNPSNQPTRRRGHPSLPPSLHPFHLPGHHHFLVGGIELALPPSLPPSFHPLLLFFAF